MELYQFSSAITALVCAVMFALAARKTRDRTSRYMEYLWVVVMTVAASGYLLIVFTELDASVLVVSRVLTPIGWGALSIIAARRVAHRDK